MPRALKVCATPRCPNLTRSGRCTDCETKADRARGTAAERGYGHRWRTVIAPRFLRRHPFCACTDTDHGHGPKCTAPATVPDHHPVPRRELVRQGVADPDADHRLRPLCKPCHDKHTAATTPGGWHGRS